MSSQLGKAGPCNKATRFIDAAANGRYRLSDFRRGVNVHPAHSSIMPSSPDNRQLVQPVYSCSRPFLYHHYQQLSAFAAVLSFHYFGQHHHQSGCRSLVFFNFAIVQTRNSRNIQQEFFDDRLLQTISPWQRIVLSPGHYAGFSGGIWINDKVYRG